MHESRHKHALKRSRGVSGRFTGVTKPQSPTGGKGESSNAPEVIIFLSSHLDNGTENMIPQQPSNYAPSPDHAQPSTAPQIHLQPSALPNFSRSLSPNTMSQLIEYAGISQVVGELDPNPPSSSSSSLLPTSSSSLSPSSSLHLPPSLLNTLTAIVSSGGCGYEWLAPPPQKKISLYFFPGDLSDLEMAARSLQASSLPTLSLPAGASPSSQNLYYQHSSNNK